MADPQAPIVFDHTVDGLARFLRTLATPRLRERLAGAGLALDAKKHLDAPYPAWKEYLKIAREELYPTLPEGRGYFDLADRFTASYFDTLFGSAVANMLKLLGPRRALARATQNFRSANNFTETKLVEKTPKEMEFWIDQVEHPEFTSGILYRALTVAGGKNVTVKLLTYTGAGKDCSFKVSWD